METAPNARSTDKDGEVKYTTAGGALKIRYAATRDKGWLEFSPANLHVEFNGAPVEFCQGIELTIGPDALPTAKLTFTLVDVDIDVDTLIWLRAHLDAKSLSGVSTMKGDLVLAKYDSTDDHVLFEGVTEPVYLMDNLPAEWEDKLVEGKTYQVHIERDSVGDLVLVTLKEAEHGSDEPEGQ